MREQQLSRDTAPHSQHNRQDSRNQNDVDSWIDELDESDSGESALVAGGEVNANAMVGWMVQQYLPKMELPTFNGTPHEWVNFIVKFRDIVHRQQYLSHLQKNILLLQHLKGEAHRAVKSFANDPRGYVRSLKKTKISFWSKISSS